MWASSHLLPLAIYNSTSCFPDNEKYGLTSQLRRAAASIPTNIAEGLGRDGKAELKQFLNISIGSACEVEYLLLLAKDLGYLTEASHEPLNRQILEVKKMLSSYFRKVVETI